METYHTDEVRRGILVDSLLMMVITCSPRDHVPVTAKAPVSTRISPDGRSKYSHAAEEWVSFELRNRGSLARVFLKHLKHKC